jgi:LacI family transcriptional regulator
MWKGFHTALTTVRKGLGVKGVGSNHVPTIKDVAHLAGVGVGTVSRVLNNSGYVSVETKRKVEMAIDQLSFSPSPLARDLTLKITHTIGLLLPDIANPFFPAMAKAVEYTASQHGYGVFLCNTDNNPREEEAYVNMFRVKRVDGVVWGGIDVRADLIEQLQTSGINVVLLDRFIAGAIVDTITIDNIKAARAATEYLYRLGHRVIGHIAGPLDLSTSKDRAEGYERALRDSGIGYSPALVAEGDFQFDGGYRGASDLLDSGHPITAIFAANDLMAVGAMHACTDRGLRVPEDVSIVGFDDIPMASIVRPRLTTIAQPSYQLGMTAATLLIDRLEGHHDGPPRQMVLETTLILRETCMPLS